VFLGTLYPLFVEALGGGKVSVGAPYFNATFLPIMAPLVAAMAIGPLLAWKRADLPGALGRLKVAALLTLLAALVAVYLHRGGPLFAWLGMALAAWLFAGALTDWAGRIKLFRAPLGESWRRARGLPRSARALRRTAAPTTPATPPASPCSAKAAKSLCSHPKSASTTYSAGRPPKRRSTAPVWPTSMP
jgi:cytochrome c-type biogenesis protein CcmF